MPTMHNPAAIHTPQANYSHAAHVGPNARWVVASGQIGVGPDGKLAEGFTAQCKTAFDNLLGILADADMAPENIVKTTVFLTNREDLGAYRQARDAAFGDLKPASTLLFVAGLASPEMLVEIEMVAAKD